MINDSLPTKKSPWFDVIGGLVFPIVCVVLAPIVFKTSFITNDLENVFGGPLLQRYAVLRYLEIVIGLAAFTILLWRRPASPFLAGVLFTGAIFSFVCGLLITDFVRQIALEAQEVGRRGIRPLPPKSLGAREGRSRFDFPDKTRTVILS
jgi:hypothetical protein